MSSLIPTIARPDHCSETLNLLTIAQPTFSLKHINNGCTTYLKRNYVISPTKNFKYKLNSVFSNFRNNKSGNHTAIFKVFTRQTSLEKPKIKKPKIKITSLHHIKQKNINKTTMSNKQTNKYDKHLNTELSSDNETKGNEEILSDEDLEFRITTRTENFAMSELMIKNYKLSPLLLSPNISMSIMNLKQLVLSIHTEDKINKKHEQKRKKLTTLSRFFVFTLSTNPKKGNKFLQHESSSFINYIKGMVKIRNQGFFVKEYG